MESSLGSTTVVWQRGDQRIVIDPGTSLHRLQVAVRWDDDWNTEFEDALDPVLSAEQILAAVEQFSSPESVDGEAGNAEVGKRRALFCGEQQRLVFNGESIWVEERLSEKSGDGKGLWYYAKDAKAASTIASVIEKMSKRLDGYERMRREALARCVVV